MLTLWFLFHLASKVLQAAIMHLKTCALMYESLETYLVEMRNKFEEFKIKAEQLFPEADYLEKRKRKRKRKIPPNDGNVPEITFNLRENFQVNTFTVIFDTLVSVIQSRGKVYIEISEKIFIFS